MFIYLKYPKIHLLLLLLYPGLGHGGGGMQQSKQNSPDFLLPIAFPGRDPEVFPCTHILSLCIVSGYWLVWGSGYSQIWLPIPGTEKREQTKLETSFSRHPWCCLDLHHQEPVTLASLNVSTLNEEFLEWMHVEAQSGKLMGNPPTVLWYRGLGGWCRQLDPSWFFVCVCVFCSSALFHSILPTSCPHSSQEGSHLPFFGFQLTPLIPLPFFLSNWSRPTALLVFKKKVFCDSKELGNKFQLSQWYSSS